MIFKFNCKEIQAASSFRHLLRKFCQHFKFERTEISLHGMFVILRIHGANEEQRRWMSDFLDSSKAGLLLIKPNIKERREVYA